MPHSPECQDAFPTSRFAQGSPEKSGLEFGNWELPLLANEHAALLMLVPSQAVCSLPELVTRLYVMLRTLQNTIVNITNKSSSLLQIISCVQNKNKPCDSYDLRHPH